MVAENLRVISRLMRRDIERARGVTAGRAPTEVYIHFRLGRRTVTTIEEVELVCAALEGIADQVEALAGPLN